MVCNRMASADEKGYQIFARYSLCSALSYLNKLSKRDNLTCFDQLF